MRRLSAFGLCLLLCVNAVPIQAEASSEAYCVMAEDGRVLMGENLHQTQSVASISKIMTAVVALEHGLLEEELEAGEEIKLAVGSSIYLKQGEKMSLQDLLYGLMLRSGNDAAMVIACELAGDVETFVGWMNQRAQDLGMTHTHFSDPNGLGDENHYASALDMAKLGRACLQNPTVAEAVATKSLTLEDRQLVNHNKLLWQYEGCTGMKTGYTRQAGRTLVSSAERDGQTLICVTLNDRNDWADHKALLDYGFSAYPRTVLAQAGEELGRVPLEGSLLHMAAAEARETVAYPLQEGERVTVQVDLPDAVQAPVVQGEIAGTARFLVNGQVVGETYLVWSSSANRDVVDRKGLGSLWDFLQGEEAPTFAQALELLEP